MFWVWAFGILFAFVIWSLLIVFGVYFAGGKTSDLLLLKKEGTIAKGRFRPFRFISFLLAAILLVLIFIAYELVLEVGGF